MTRFFILLFVCFLNLKAENIFFSFELDKQISKNKFLETLSQNKYILLGEQHDNVFHHEAKIEIFEYFKDKNITVATEHLDFEKKVVWQNESEKALSNVDFDFKGWQWPIHKNLYDWLSQNKINIVGANLNNKHLKEINQNNNFDNLQQLIDKFALEKNAEEILENELIQNHCGFIKKPQTTTLKKMQLAKDIMMAKTLMKFENDNIFLIAGNNHIRKDFAIPRIFEKSGIKKFLVVGFFGKKEFEHNKQNLSKNFDFAVVTKDVETIDYCKNLKLENFQKFKAN